MEQGTQEWFDARCGLVTASRVADVCAKTKSGWGASRKNYQAQLIAERLTGNVTNSFSSTAMQWGTDTEPQARAAYEFLTDTEVSEIGFVVHPKMELSGASPDGLIGDDGLIEIKCPNTATHIDTLIARKVPVKYITQMQWQMACTGRKWCDFVSFDPRMPDGMDIFLERVDRDSERIEELEDIISGFLHETEAKIETLKSL